MIRCLFLLATFAISMPTVVAQSAFSGMRYRVPTDANTLVMINAEKMFGSEVADRERWNARRQAAYDAGLSALPPDAKEVLLAGRSDLEFGKSIWELALVRLKGDRNVSTVAQRFGGAMDNVEGRTAAKLPNDRYVIQISDDLLGTYTPANRQDVSRWLRKTDTTTTDAEYSPYLVQAFKYATEVGTPIIMAMDVENTLSTELVKSRLEAFQPLKESGVDLGELTKLIAGVKGVTLGVTVTDKTVGAVRVDFSGDAGLLAEIGKPLLIQVLQRQGAMIDDFHDWTPSVSGNTLMLRGTLSTDGARRVMSILELPHELSDSMQLASSPGSDPEGSAKKIAAQQYYNSVTTLIEDLREKPKRDHVKTFGQAAMWYDRYARKIDNLPILKVDEELLNYGSNIAELFRSAEMSMKGVGMRASNRRASNNAGSGGYYYSSGGYRSGYGYNSGGYGPQGYTASVGAGQASLREKGRTDAIITRQERTAGAASVQQIWQVIDQETAGIRRMMTEKYQIEF
ncbi:hypothetical protein Enr13x_75630 [Stieleria neptunia]|uniref:Uncharacterized protein n=1 Tax=Stieleria neptunia TaxID=2527979 RepID=A0A518I3G3_9BACT|nr:hypothetical protein [Stieleria neptunia]QDV47652.1 hypothetical protein Enr13x_75630 [Stieleria neptunia]